MSFQKISLKSQQRKKKVASLKKKVKITGKLFGIFALGVMLFIPKTIWNTLRKKKEEKHRKNTRILFSLSFVFVALVIAFAGTESGQETGKNIAKNVIFTFGADLPKDANGFTNFLLLGAGGEAHAEKGHKLTDAIMIASVDVSGRSVVILSIPRDFYIETEHVRGRINEIIRDESNYFLGDIKKKPENAAKLKELKREQYKKFLWKLEAEADAMATEVMRKEVEEIFEISIHRTARIDFNGFEKFVDTIGGIDIVVEKTIDDPTYPDFDWGYNPFRLKAGHQHLDGATALKYARSRHGTSDFDRAKRQQNVMSAMKEKMTSLKILISPKKLKNILDIVQENYVSDITWDEIITMAKFASRLPKERILTYVLNNDSAKPGGFLVTPNRELYGGGFVLVPFLNLETDKFAQIRVFTKMIFDHRSVAEEGSIPIVILNGTKRKGLAGEAQIQLERYGWKISNVGNREDVQEETTIEYTNVPQNKEVVELLQRFIPAKVRVKEFHQPKENGVNAETKEDTNVSAELSDTITIILGNDYRQLYRVPDFSFQ